MLLMKKPSTGIKLGFLLIIVGIAIQAAVIWTKDYPIFIMISDYDVESVREYVPWHTWAAFNYIPSYVIGLMLGLAITRDIRIPEKLLPILWFLGVQFYVGSIMWGGLLLSLPIKGVEFPQLFTNFTGISADKKLPNSYAQFFGIIMRTWISIWVALTYYLMWHEKDPHRNTDGKLDPISLYMRFNRWIVRFNSNKYFVYLGKFSFPSYIMHYMATVHLWSISDQPAYLSFPDMCMRVCYVFIVSIIGGLFVHLVFEAPMLNFLKIVTGIQKSEVKEEKIVEQKID